MRIVVLAPVTVVTYAIGISSAAIEKYYDEKPMTIQRTTVFQQDKEM